MICSIGRFLLGRRTGELVDTLSGRPQSLPPCHVSMPVDKEAFFDIEKKLDVELMSMIIDRVGISRFTCAFVCKYMNSALSLWKTLHKPGHAIDLELVYPGIPYVGQSQWFKLTKYLLGSEHKLGVSRPEPSFMKHITLSDVAKSARCGDCGYNEMIYDWQIKVGQLQAKLEYNPILCFLFCFIAVSGDFRTFKKCWNRYKFSSVRPVWLAERIGPHGLRELFHCSFSVSPTDRVMIQFYEGESTETIDTIERKYLIVPDLLSSAIDVGDSLEIATFMCRRAKKDNDMYKAIFGGACRNISSRLAMRHPELIEEISG